MFRNAKKNSCMKLHPKKNQNDIQVSEKNRKIGNCRLNKKCN